MEPALIRSLLPCHVCGDLPPEVAAAVEAALALHPELAREAAFLRASRADCLEALGALAEDDSPLFPSFEDALTPIPGHSAAEARSLGRPVAAVVRPSARADGWRGLVLGVAAAVALFAGLQLSPGAVAGSELLAWQEQLAGPQAALQRSSDPAQIARTLRQAGVPAGLVRVPDLGGMGLTLVGASPLGPNQGLGSVVVYEGPMGLVSCAFAAHVPLGDTPVASAQVAGRELMAYEDSGHSVVVWRDGGLYCVFSAAIPAEQLLAMVRMRVEGSAPAKHG